MAVWARISGYLFPGFLSRRASSRLATILGALSPGRKIPIPAAGVEREVGAQGRPPEFWVLR